MSAFAKAKDPRRVHERHGTDTITCPLGEVQDISATGMRVSVKGFKRIAVGQMVPMRIKVGGANLALRARVRWIDGSWHQGLLGRQIGFAFEGLKPDQVKVLGAVARFGFLPRSKAARNAFAAADQEASFNPSPDAAKNHRGPGASRANSKPQADGDQADGGSDWAWGKNGSRVDVSIVLSEYYQALGLESGADRETIKSAYRNLAKSCHPDVAVGEDSQNRFVAINQAYHMLMQNVA